MSGKIESLNDLGRRYDVTINCTGLGAKFLCDDHKLVPLRGQVMKVGSLSYVDYVFPKPSFTGEGTLG